MKNKALLLIIAITICILTACSTNDGLSETYTDDAQSETQTTQETETESTEPEGALYEQSPDDIRQNLSIEAGDDNKVKMEFTADIGDGERFFTVLGEYRYEGESHNGGECGINEIQIMKDGEVKQDIILADVVDSEYFFDNFKEGFTDCFNMIDTVILADVNFDGYQDLQIFASTGNNYIPYHFLCYNPDTELYEYGFTIQLVEIDDENQELVSETRLSASSYIIQYYNVTDDYKLKLIREEYEEYTADGNVNGKF